MTRITSQPRVRVRSQHLRMVKRSQPRVRVRSQHLKMVKRSPKMASGPSGPKARTTSMTRITSPAMDARVMVRSQPSQKRPSKPRMVKRSQKVMTRKAKRDTKDAANSLMPQRRSLTKPDSPTETRLILRPMSKKTDGRLSTEPPTRSETAKPKDSSRRWTRPTLKPMPKRPMKMPSPQEAHPRMSEASTDE